MDYGFKNLKTTGNVVRGIANYILVAPKFWFATNGIQAPAAPFTSQGDMITIKTPHVFNAGKGFIYLQLSPQKNKIDEVLSGDPGLASIASSLELFLPGSDIAKKEQMQQFANVPMIVLGKDANCGLNMFYQLGCDCTEAYMTWNFSTSTSKDGNKGYTGKIEYDGSLQYYMVDGGPAILAD